MAEPKTTESAEITESREPYARIFWVLLVVTVALYGYARLQSMISFAALVSGLSILAAIYAFLVAWYFMHLKYEGRWIIFMLVPICVLSVVVIAGLTPDIAYHQLGFTQSTAVADR